MYKSFIYSIVIKLTEKITLKTIEAEVYREVQDGLEWMFSGIPIFSFGLIEQIDNHHNLRTACGNFYYELAGKSPH